MKKIFFLTALLAVLSTSCTKDDNTIANSESNKSNAPTITGKAATLSSSNPVYQDPDYKYAFMMNNVWNTANSGTDKGQTMQYNSVGSWNISAYCTKGSNPNYSEVKSYPAIVFGNHYGTKPTTNIFPKLVSALTSTQLFKCTWDSQVNNTNTSTSIWNSSFDIWFDPSSTNNGTNLYEIMIWTAYNIQTPVGSLYKSSVTIDGKVYDVWKGDNLYSNGTIMNHVLTFRLLSNSGKYGKTGYSANLRSFIDAATSTAYGSWMPKSTYMTSIQAGFEICTAGYSATNKASFVTNSFSPNF